MLLRQQIPSLARAIVSGHRQRHYSQQAIKASNVAAKDGSSEKYATIHITSADGTERIPVKTRRFRKWTTHERQRLLRLVVENKTEGGAIDWEAVAGEFPGTSTVKCKNAYLAVIKEVSASASTPMFQGRGNAGDPSQIQGGSLASFGIVSAIWTKDDDDMLLALYNLEGRQWSVISQAIGKYTPAECKSRYNMLLSASKRSEKTTQTKASGIYKYEPLKTANGMIVWTKAEDERLRELVIEKRRFDHLDLRRHFPGFNYYNIYNALQRLSAEPGHVKGLWTNAEHRSLLKLIDEYGDDWLKVAENMPTRRTVSQCRAHYMTCCTKPVVKRGRWSNEEEEKLRHLVAICKEGKLRPEIEVFYQSKSGSSQPSLIKGSASSKSPRDISLARFELYSRFADALKRDKGSRTDAQGKNSTATKIVWPLVASYMETRSVTQCRLKWFYMQKGRGSEDAVYSGPWTRGEDAALYKLYHKHPRRWLWIAQNLPRRRKWISVRARYNSYVRRYVDMLKECKPAGWDPADDQFEEVHARCEILAWYRGQLEGYRAGDPYQCPYDMDLTGYKEWIKETSADAAEKAGLPFESNTEKTGWSARAVPHKNRKQ